MLTIFFRNEIKTQWQIYTLKKIWYSSSKNEKHIEHVLFSKKMFSEDLRIDIKQIWDISATPTSADKVG